MQVLSYLFVVAILHVVQVEGWAPVHVRSVARYTNLSPVVSLSSRGVTQASTLPNAGNKHYSLTSSTRSASVLQSSSNNNNPNYSDDFFGLIFIGSSVGLKDAVFGAVFLILSFVAATFSRNSAAYDTLKLPGIVAVASLVLSLVLKLVLPPIEIPGALTDPTTATLVEAVVCLASFAYTASMSSKEEEKSS